MCTDHRARSKKIQKPKIRQANHNDMRPLETWFWAWQLAGDRESVPDGSPRSAAPADPTKTTSFGGRGQQYLLLQTDSPPCPCGREGESEKGSQRHAAIRLGVRQSRCQLMGFWGPNLRPHPVRMLLCCDSQKPPKSGEPGHMPARTNRMDVPEKQETVLLEGANWPPVAGEFAIKLVP